MTVQGLREQADSTLEHLKALHPDLEKDVREAYAYVVFPSVGRASVVLGISYGKGVVFEQGRPIGIATLAALTIGVQVGGQSFTEIVLVPTKAALDQLKRGELAFAANASAVLVKAAASGTSDFKGVTARAYSQGGLLLELSLGGQRLRFQPSAELASERPGPQVIEEELPRPTEEPQAAASEQKVEEPEEPEVEGGRASRIAARAREFMNGLGLEDRIPGGVKRRFDSARRRIANTSPFALLRKEQTVSKTLHPEAKAALADLLGKAPDLRERLDKAAGFAIFPAVGKASAVLGATFGRGEVYERGRLVGYAGLIQLTVGVQVGGDVFTELIIFEHKSALDDFKRGKLAFTANAAAVFVKAGASATRGITGSAVRLDSEGGMLVEAAIGGQKVVFRKAALTRGKSWEMAPREHDVAGPTPQPAPAEKAPGEKTSSEKASAEKASVEKGAHRVMDTLAAASGDALAAAKTGKERMTGATERATERATDTAGRVAGAVEGTVGAAVDAAREPAKEDVVEPAKGAAHRAVKKVRRKVRNARWFIRFERTHTGRAITRRYLRYKAKRAAKKAAKKVHIT